MRITSHPLRGAAATLAVRRSAVFDRSNSVYLRFVEPTDADLIDVVRGSPELTRGWLQHYKLLEAEGREFCFVTVVGGQDRSVVCMKDFTEIGGETSFSWEESKLHSSRSAGSLAATALAVYTIGFDVLGFARSHVLVRKSDTGRAAFHMQTGADLEYDDGHYLYLRVGPRALAYLRDESLVAELA